MADQPNSGLTSKPVPVGADNLTVTDNAVGPVTTKRSTISQVIENNPHSDIAPNTAHRALTNNPHSVTAAQVGSPTTAVFNDHDARHIPGGADALPTGTPLSTGIANAEGVASAFARQDHVHNTVLQNSIAAGVGPTVIVGDQVVETLTPGAGTYLAIFSGYADVTTATGTYTYRIRANGADNAASERVHDNTGKVAFADVPLIVHTIALVTVADAQAIDIEFTDGVGVTTVINRSLILIKLG